MRCDYLLNSILAINLREEGIYSSIKASKVVEACFEVIRGINKLSSACWEDLSNQFAIYRANRNYYIKYGGVAPTLENQLEYRAKLSKLNEVKKQLLDGVDSIKRNKWSYDIGFCKFIREMREIIRISY